MNYIINPVWFYLFGVIGALQCVAIVLLIISAVVFFVSLIIFLANSEYGSDDPDAMTARKIIKISIPVFAISALLVVLLPSKNTMIEMQIARFATYENANWTIETIKSAVDYIVQAIESIK